MNHQPGSALKSNKVRGTLWLVAAAPMLLAPAIFGGNSAVAGIGILFMIIGLVTLRRI